VAVEQSAAAELIADIRLEEGDDNHLNDECQMANDEYHSRSRAREAEIAEGFNI